MSADNPKKQPRRARKYLGLRVDADVMNALKCHAAQERRAVSVLVRDILIEKLRASGFEI